MSTPELKEALSLGPCPYELVGEEEQIYKGRWLGLRQVHFIDPTTKAKGVWQIAYRTTKPPGANADGIDIIPILKEKGRKYLLLVKQYRIPIGGWSLELPAGLVDAGESMEAAGLRELKEETGYTADKVLFGGESKGIQFLDPGMSNDSVNFLTVEVDGDAEVNQNPQQALDTGESGLQVVKLPLENLLSSLDECAGGGLHVEAMLYTLGIGLQMAGGL